MLERKCSTWLSDLGYAFVDGFTVAEFVEDARCRGCDLLTKDGFQKQIKSMCGIDVLVKKSEFELDISDYAGIDFDGMRKDHSVDFDRFEVASDMSDFPGIDVDGRRDHGGDYDSSGTA
eukprot:12413214-Karenia_brevis.AAC.1